MSVKHSELELHLTFVDLKRLMIAISRSILASLLDVNEMRSNITPLLQIYRAIVFSMKIFQCVSNNGFLFKNIIIFL